MSHEGLLGLLYPVSQLAIAAVLLVVLVIATRKLASRGRSRMGRALLVTGAAAVAILVLGVLLTTW